VSRRVSKFGHTAPTRSSLDTTLCHLPLLWIKQKKIRNGQPQRSGSQCDLPSVSPPEPIVYALCAVPITLSLPVVTTQIAVSPVKNVKNALLAGKSRGKSGSKSRDIQARYSRRVIHLVIHVAKKLCGAICKSISRLPCNTVLMTTVCL